MSSFKSNVSKLITFIQFISLLFYFSCFYAFRPPLISSFLFCFMQKKRTGIQRLYALSASPPVMILMLFSPPPPDI